MSDEEETQRLHGHPAEYLMPMRIPEIKVFTLPTVVISPVIGSPNWPTVTVTALEQLLLESLSPVTSSTQAP